MADRQEKRIKYAWAKYYSAMNSQHEDMARMAEMIASLTRDVKLNSTLPVHLIEEIEEMATFVKKKFECPICMDFIEVGQLEITCCGHKYCKDCFKTLMETSAPKCSICRKQFSK